MPLEPVAETQTAVGIACSLISCRCPISGDHGRALPARQTFEIAFLPPIGKPLVGERVPQLVWVKRLDAGHFGAPLEHDGKPRFTEHSPSGEPEQLECGVGMSRSG